MKYIPGTFGNRVVTFLNYVTIPLYKLNQFRALVLEGSQDAEEQKSR
jgi:hypothetical protein